MLQNINDPYDRLLHILQQTTNRQDFEQIEKESKICICIGISKQNFEEITNQLSDYQIQIIQQDECYIIKRFFKNNHLFYMCYLSDIETYIQNMNEEGQINENRLKDFKISIIRLYLQLQKQQNKIHYLVNKNININDENGNEDKQFHFTIVTFETDQNLFHILKKNKICKSLNPSQLLKEIKKSKFETDNSFLQLQAIRYIQEEVDEFLMALKVKDELKAIYQNLDLCSQFPRCNEDFQLKFSRMVFSFKKVFDSFEKKGSDQQNDNKSMEMLVSIYNTLDKFLLSLDQELKKIYDSNHQSIIDFCKCMGVNLKDIKFEFKIIVKKLIRIAQTFSDLNMNMIDWGLVEILNIKELINFISQYIEEEKKFDLDLILQKFQNPFKVNEQKKVVFMFGLTKVGKSTVTSIIQDPENTIVQFVNYQKVYGKKLNQEQFSINNTGFSNTQRFIEILETEYIVFFDCPGLNDTDEQFRVINMYNISQNLKQYEKPIIIIVIDSENEATFLKNFKETMEYLDTFSASLFEQINKPLFILTKMEVYIQDGIQRSFVDNFCQDQKKIERRNDFINLKAQTDQFYRAYFDQRVLYFPHARENANLNLFREQIFETIQRININEFSLNLQVDFKSNKQFKILYEELQQAIQKRVIMVLDFMFLKLRNTVLHQRRQSVDELLKQVENSIELIKNFQTKNETAYQIIKQIEQQLYQQYDVQTFHSRRFKNFKTAQQIFPFDLQNALKKHLEYFENVKQQIKNLIIKEAGKCLLKAALIQLSLKAISALGPVGILFGCGANLYMSISMLDKTSIVSKFLYPSQQQFEKQLVGEIQKLEQNQKID